MNSLTPITFKYFAWGGYTWKCREIPVALFNLKTQQIEYVPMLFVTEHF